MHPPNLSRRIAPSICAITAAICAAPLAFTQTATATGSAPGVPSEGVSLDAYDVVSIKPVGPGSPSIGMEYLPDGFRGGPIGVIVQQAYSSEMTLQSTNSVKGLPAWTLTDWYKFEGKMSPEQAAAFAKLTPDQQKQRRELMLRALLADRLKLKVHHLTEQVPSYDLVIAKGGPKMTEGVLSGADRLKWIDGKTTDRPMMMIRSRGKVEVQLFTVAEFVAAILNQPVFGPGRLVVDKTGLTGRYSFIFTFAPQYVSTAAPPGEALSADDSAPPLPDALQEELGLKLVPSTGTLDTVVVDHIERPTPD